MNEMLAVSAGTLLLIVCAVWAYFWCQISDKERDEIERQVDAEYWGNQ